MNNSLVAQLSTVIDNISKHFQPVPKQLSETSVDKSPKPVRKTSETYETLSKPDGRSKPRTQRQIESYKKNFSKRHKSKGNIPQSEDKPSESLTATTLYDEIFSHHKVYKRK